MGRQANYLHGELPDVPKHLVASAAPRDGVLNVDPRRRRRPAIVRYVVALSSVGAALIVIWWMDRVFHAPAHVSAFLCAAMFSAWFGGFGPGLLASGAAVLAFNYFYMSSPLHSLALDVDQLPRLVLFAISAAFVVSLTAAQRRTSESLSQAHDALQQHSGELEEINRSLRAENDQRTRAEYLSGRMFEISRDHIAVIGRDYRFRQVTKAYERLSNMTMDQIVGMYYPDVLGAHIFELAKPHLDRCFKGEQVRFAGWFPLRPGNRYVVGTCAPLRPSSQEVEAALVVSRDLTDSVRAAEALREAQAKLEQVTRVTTLGEVTASLGHELNQPLAAIVNNANACLGLLPADAVDADEVRSALADIVSDAERASAIIGRVRALAKRSLTERASVRLADVVDDVLALVAANSHDRRVTIYSDVPPDLPVVLGDRVQLQQVLLNLIVNGMDAMSTVDPPARKIEIRAQADTQDGNPAVRISVTDRGIGLGPEQADRLFEAFYTTKAHGMGLGLSISRSIVEVHGGRLWAERNAGPGATFCFRLPAGPTAA